MHLHTAQTYNLSTSNSIQFDYLNNISY